MDACCLLLKQKMVKNSASPKRPFWGGGRACHSQDKVSRIFMKYWFRVQNKNLDLEKSYHFHCL